MSDNNTLLAMGGRDFMRLYPVVSLQRADGGPERVIKGDPINSLARVASTSRVLFGNLAAMNNYMGLNLVTAPHCRDCVRITLGTAGPGVPLFHLPYNNDQNFRVTLLDKQNVGNVNFFITEFVDGCSVYVEGDPAGPTAYHINAVNTHRTKNWKQFYWSDNKKRRADWQAKYAKMDQRFKTEGTMARSVQNDVNGQFPRPTKLENHDYMGDLGLNLAALQMAQKSPTHAGPQSIDGFELLSQQGTIFGEKRGGIWKFYVQRRALVRYLHLPANGIPVPLSSQWVVHSVEQFWPTAKTGRVVV